MFAAPYLTFDAGYSGSSVGLADFNGDGKLDVAATDESGDALWVLLGNGDGTFAPGTMSVTGSWPMSLAIEDLNGDGKPDVAIANGISGSISILLGRGDGTFAPKHDIAIGSNRGGIAIADLNGDGYLDLAFGGSASASIMLGNGDGTFGPKIDFTTGSAVYALAIGDLNGDGKPDIVVGSSNTPNVQVFLGNGGGTFAPGGGLEVPVWPTAVAIGDVNGDGHPDLAVTSYNDSALTVVLGNGDGTWGARTDLHSGPKPSGVAIGDLNSDGKHDVVVTAGASWQYPIEFSGGSVFLGNGDGSFAPVRIFEAGLMPTAVAMGDVNGDGRPDLAIATQRTPALSLLLGNGDGMFGTTLHSRAGSIPEAVAIRDLNHDGRPDLAIFDLFSGVQSSGEVSILMGNGDATFGPLTAYATGEYPRAMLAADLNRDGHTDVAVANTGPDVSQPGSVSVILGSGDGTFLPKVSYETGRFPESIAVGDLNEDGSPDLVTVASDSCTISVLLGNGDGTFRRRADYRPLSGPCHSVAVGDFDEDGHEDLVVSTQSCSPHGCGYSYEAFILPGRGDGTFGAPRDFPVDGVAWSTAVGDLNGDGRPDIVMSAGYSSIGMLLGRGGGTFAPEIDLLAEQGTSQVVIGDLNGDGFLDLAVVNAGAQSISVLLGNGDGTFKPALGFGTETGPTSLAIGDLNGDGRPDLAVTCQWTGTVLILLNTGPSVPVSVGRPSTRVHTEPGLVRLDWSVTIPAMLSAIVYRRPTSGAWNGLGRVKAIAADQVEYEDHGVSAGTYAYRLGYSDPAGERFTAEVLVNAPSAPMLALDGTRPNPANHDLVAAFSLPDSRPALLEVLDVSGRRVFSRKLEGMGAGRHLMALTDSRVLPAGVYLLRLTQGQRSLTVSAVIIR